MLAVVAMSYEEEAEVMNAVNFWNYILTKIFVFPNTKPQGCFNCKKM
jgi:hypothetical protein